MLDQWKKPYVLWPPWWRCSKKGATGRGQFLRCTHFHSSVRLLHLTLSSTMLHWFVLNYTVLISLFWYLDLAQPKKQRDRVKKPCASIQVTHGSTSLVALVALVRGVERRHQQQCGHSSECVCLCCQLANESVTRKWNKFTDKKEILMIYFSQK